MEKAVKEKAVKLRVDKLVPGMLAIKRFILSRLEEELAELLEKGASREEVRWLRIRIRGYRNRIAYLEKKRGSGDPPVFGELLLLLLLPQETSEYQLGDLAEEYRRREELRGRAYADLCFYGEAAHVAWWKLRKPLGWIVLVLLSSLISDLFLKFIAGLF